MGKAEEYRVKKRNKATRKRLSNTVDFTQGIQAAKRRRKAGRRRICEGMCFSLPTPDDPFNDLYKEKIARKRAKNDQQNADEGVESGGKEVSKVRSHGKKPKAKLHTGSMSSTRSDKKKKSCSVPKHEANTLDGTFNKAATEGLPTCASGEVPNGTFYEANSTTVRRVKWKPGQGQFTKVDNIWTCAGGSAFEIALCALLNSNIMTESKQHESNGIGELALKSEQLRMGSKLEWLFWEACGSGSDVLATMGTAATTIRLTSAVLAAVAHISALTVQKTLPLSPVVLFILQTKEQTLNVRSFFKVLKPCLGVHSVSLHMGTPLQHQIEGLRSTPAEILVATADRLCELLSANAVSLLNVSFMVIDGLDSIISSGFSDQLLHIRANVADNVQTVLSGGNLLLETYTLCQKLIKEPICRVISDTSLSQCSSWISQIVYVLLSEDRKQQKLHKIVQDHFEKRGNAATSGELLVVFRQSQTLQRVKAAVLEEEGYSVDCFLGDSTSRNNTACSVLNQFRNGQVEVLLSTEDCIDGINLGALRTVVLYEFPSTMDLYGQILRRMARRFIKGTLYSFCSGSMAPLASELVRVLDQCSQPVPSSLKMLVEAATLAEQRKPSKVGGQKTIASPA